MAKTVVGLFDNMSEAQAVVQDLLAKGFRQNDISIVANDTHREVVKDADHAAPDGDHVAASAGGGAVTGGLVGGGLGLVLGLLGATAIPVIGPIVSAGPILAALTGAGIGAAAGGLIGALTAAGVPEEDANYYAEGVNRGSTLVTVNARDENAQTAYDVMQNHGAVDIDERGAEYRAAGWTGYDTNAKPYNAEQIETYRSTRTASANRTTDRQTAGRTLDQGEAVVPVVEEELQVGKRQVERGGVRVYTRVEEKPIEAQVQLREEHVNVERRAVNRPVTEADLAAMKDTTLEVTEMAEEAVVAKQARIVEEVVIDKNVEQRTETVRDTVRRTDVDVENLAGGTTATGYESYDTDFRNNFQTNYAQRGYTYEHYAPVYRYGYNLASDTRYAGKDWNSIESQVRKDWEGKNPDSKWEDFKDSIKYAWDKVRGRA